MLQALQQSVPEPVNLNVAQQEHPSCTLKQLIDEYLANIQVAGSCMEHRRSISYVAEKLYYPYFGKYRPINSIAYGDILGFMTKIENEPSERNGRPRSLITVNRHGHFLCAFFRYAVDMEYLDNNPMSRWRPKKVPPKEVKLNLEDFQK